MKWGNKAQGITTNLANANRFRGEGEQERTMFQDRVLAEIYVSMNIPCDPLVRSQKLVAEFAAEYTRRTGEDVQHAELAAYLHNLRRKGQENGGLPRLRNRY